DGSVRRSGNHIRVTAHLVDVVNQTTLWTERFDRDLTDTIKLQDEIAAAIAVALDVALSLNSARSMVDPIAYELYLRTLRPTFAPEEFAADIGLLEEATRRAPDFAAAWGRLAVQRVRALLFRPLAERPALQKEAVAAADRALQLDSKSGTAYLALYWLESPLGRWLERQKLLEMALADSASGNLAWFMRALFLAQVGRFSDAIACAWDGYMRDRADPGASNQPGWILVRAGRFREARPLLEAVLARWPEAYYAATNLILACAHEGDWNAVDRLIDPERLAKFPLREFSVVLGYVALLRNPSPEARQQVMSYVRHRFEQTGHLDIQLLMLAAHFCSIDEVFEIAETADFGLLGDEDDRVGPIFDRCAALFQYPYSTVRRDPRFVRLCARFGLVEFWMKTGLWPDCADEVPYDFKAECEKAMAEARRA
ncbi:MAG: tetratricopeptide repeat protein, partial [Micropepsaceae bacterium]